MIQIAKLRKLEFMEAYVSPGARTQREGRANDQLLPSAASS